MRFLPDFSQSDRVASRLVGTRVPYPTIFKNTAILQVARGSDESVQRGHAVVDEQRLQMIHALRDVMAGDFMESQWPELVSRQGLEPPELAERDRVEFRVLNVLATHVKPGLPVSPNLLATISRASGAAMQHEGSSDEILYATGGLNVLETALTTSVCNAIGQPHDELLYAGMTQEQSEKHGPLIQASVRKLADRIGCAVIFEEE